MAARPRLTESWARMAVVSPPLWSLHGSIAKASHGSVPLLVNWRLELVQVPVSDVDRAKDFYTEKIGFNADHDHRVTEELRFVQLTPPGSACSIAIGSGMEQAEPGSVRGLQIVVPDVAAARAELVD